MRNFKICYILFLLLVNHGHAKDSEFYSMGREILGDMVSIESTEAKGLATDVSEYAAAVLLENGFKSDDLQVVGPQPAMVHGQGQLQASSCLDAR